MDWKKEYRVSDLFKREKAGKEPGSGPATDAPAEPRPGVAEPSLWKKEISVSGLLRRGKRPEGPPLPPAEAPVELDREQTVFEQVKPEQPPAAEQPSVEATKAPEPAGDTPAPGEGVVASASGEPVAPPEPESSPPAEPQSIWKREIRVSSFLRKGKQERAAGSVAPSPEPASAAFAEALADADGEGPQEGIAQSASAEPESAQPERAESEGPQPEGGRPEETQADAPAPAAEAEPSRGDEASLAGAAALGAAAGASSVWKKEIKLSGLFSRKPGAPALTAERGAPRLAELRTETGAPRPGERRTNVAGPLPDVPLVRALNLLPREEVKVRTARPALPYAGVGLLAVLVVGALAFVFLNERSKIADRKAAKEDLEAQIAALQAVEETSPEEGVQIAGEALTRASALSAALDGRIVWDRLLRDLSLTLPDGVWLSAVTSAPAAVTPDAPPTPPGLTIGGYSRSQAGVAQLVSRLGVLPELSSLQLQSSTVVLLGEEEVVQFTIVATLAQMPSSGSATTAAVSPTEVTAS